jgi:pimeloyl-ACP methyl ester carboxylesterase
LRRGFYGPRGTHLNKMLVRAAGLWWRLQVVAWNFARRGPHRLLKGYMVLTVCSALSITTARSLPEFLLMPHPRHPGVQVEQGFWNVYQTMSLADPGTGVTTHQNAAEGVGDTVGTGTVVVVGHSLGSALATYFADDLAERVGSRARSG